MGVILVRIFPHSNWIRRDAEYHSVWMRENTEQKNSEYGNFSRSDILLQLVLSTSNKTLFCNKWDILCYWKTWNSILPYYRYKNLLFLRENVNNCFFMLLVYLFISLKVKNTNLLVTSHILLHFVVNLKHIPISGRYKIVICFEIMQYCLLFNSNLK